MKPYIISGLALAVLSVSGCSDAAKTDTPAENAGLIGSWKSLDDANYVLKFNADTYREFYETEEMSRDQWQPVESCEDPKPVAKTNGGYGGFQIWTQETDDRICYTISDWTSDAVSLTYAGTTASYTRLE